MRKRINYPRLGVIMADFVIWIGLLYLIKHTLK